MNSSTQVIPGHGPLSRRSQLVAYRGMLITIRDRILKEIKAGKRLKEVLNTGPTNDFDEDWGKGFIKGDAFVKLLYQDLSGK